MDEDAWRKGQEPNLLSLLAEQLAINVSDIVDFELSLFDTQGAALSGMRREFLVGSRIDNLASCFSALEALTAFQSDEQAVAEDSDVSLIALFDHEEVLQSPNNH